MTGQNELIGTWQFSRDGELAFMHFSLTRVFDYLKDGSAHQVLRLWHTLEEPGIIRLRSKRTDHGWTCAVNRDGDTLILTANGLRTVCTPANAKDIPEWFVQELTENS